MGGGWGWGRDEEWRGGGMDLESLRPYKDRQHKAINRLSLWLSVSLSEKVFYYPLREIWVAQQLQEQCYRFLSACYG